MAQLNFNAATVAPSSGQMDALPAGWYDAAIEKSEMKPTKDATGEYLELMYNVVAPPQFAGRKVFSRLNLRNNNPVAVNIAYGDLSAICHATNVIQCQASEQLHGIPHKIKVSVRAAQGDYEASNEIKAYKPINENVPLGPTSGAASGAAAGGAPAGFPQSQPPAAFQQPVTTIQQHVNQQPAQGVQPQPWAQNNQPAQQAQPAQPNPGQWNQSQGGQQQPWQQPQQPAAQAPVQQPQPQQQQPQAQQPQPWAQPQAQQPVQNQQPAQQHPAQSAVPPWAQGQQNSGQAPWQGGQPAQ